MRTLFKLSIIGFFVMFFVQPAFAAGGGHLEPLVEQAAKHAEGNNLQAVRQDLDAFHEKWEAVEDQIHEKAPQSYEAIESAYAKASALVSTNNPDPKTVEAAVENLEKAVEGYASGNTQPSKESAVSGAKALSGYVHDLKEARESAGEHNWAKAQKEYDEFHEGWKSVEDSIRSANPSAYEQIETNMGLVSAALNANPPKADKVKDSLGKLIQSVQKYRNGEGSTTPAKEKNVGTLLHILGEAQTAIGAGNAETARDEMAEFIQVWPTVEGQVKTQSAEAYEHTENNMTKALSLLSSNPPKMNQASEMVSNMKAELTPLAGHSDYSFWDAAIIMLREGLEIILILAALLSFLNKTNNSDKRPWVWGGAGAGVAASVILAFVLTAALSAAAAGSERELLEGITGLIAVVVMFTVGAWLHSKSNIGSWNKYIKDRVGTALARGSLWSLAFIAFLTVVREGAETVIFYLGMAANISTTQLTLGIAVALAILLALAFAIIKFSIKLPIRWLFLGITVLIYYLAFKFTGESVHALQVVGKVPAHLIEGFPTIDWLGINPTWETLLAQALLLALIIGQSLLVRRRQAIARREAVYTEKNNQAVHGNRS
ncbi:MAG TPA: FTR1 family protein [Bacillales bacterium]|nr:FTR1 family protein [Bacillales bacterium]